MAEGLEIDQSQAPKRDITKIQSPRSLVRDMKEDTRGQGHDLEDDILEGHIHSQDQALEVDQEDHVTEEEKGQGHHLGRQGTIRDQGVKGHGREESQMKSIQDHEGQGHEIQGHAQRQRK